MAQAGNGLDASMLPGLAPPPGVTPDFVHPYSLRGPFIGMFAFYLAITAITTALRMYTKLYITKNLGWGDYTACISMLLFVVYSSFVYSTLPYGAAIHQWNVPLTSLTQFARLCIGAEISYPPTIFFAKLSVFLQFIHFFIPDHSSKSFTVVIGLIVFNGLFCLVCVLAFALQCMPIALLWNPTLPGHCVNQSVLYITVAGIIIFSDFSMLFLPLNWIWRSMMTTKRKIGVSCVFAIGTLACITSILHLYYSVIEYGSGDATFVLAQLTFATGGEITAAILCTNLPIAPRFFREVIPKVSTFLGRYHSSDRSSSPHSPANPTLKQGPLSSWARFRQSAHKTFRPNHLGLETRDLKPGIRTLIQEEVPLETRSSAGEPEYWGERCEDMEKALEKDMVMHGVKEIQ